MIDDNSTIAEARAFVGQHWVKGVECPCCHQLVRLSPCAMNGAMVRSLINLYLLDFGKDAQFHHITEFDAWQKDEGKGFGGGQFAKLRHWRFAETLKESDHDTRTSGMWRITDKGRDFVERKISVKSHVLTYNSQAKAFKGNLVTIDQVARKRFSYRELMGDAYDTIQRRTPNQEKIL